MLTILSSYLLDDLNNGRIAAAVEAIGGGFIPAPATREERIAQLDERIAEADVLFGGRLSEEQWRNAKRLRWIHVPWAGVNSLFTLDAIRTSDVVVTNSSGVMSEAVADHVMTCVTALARELPQQVRAQQRGEWIDYPASSPRLKLLRGMTLGIVGYGAIGRAVAQRARGFGMRIIATKRNAAQAPPELDELLPSDRLGILLERSDFVVIALPLTDDTRGLIGAAELARMRPTAWLVNIARGAIVRQEELIEGLRSGVIAGAALDVFEKEPLPAGSPLWQMENVLITPHVAGSYGEFWTTTVDLFLDNLQRWLDGRPLRNVVDMEKGY